MKTRRGGRLDRPLADERLQARDRLHLPRLTEVLEPLKATSAADDQEQVQSARRILRPRRLVMSAAIAACACVVAAVALASGSGERAAPTVAVGHQAPTSEPPPLKPHPKVVHAVGPGQAPPGGGVTAGSGTVTGQQSDAEIRSELT